MLRTAEHAGIFFEETDGQGKRRRAFPPVIVEGRAEWRMAGAGAMREFYEQTGRPRGRCECQRFALPSFDAIEFALMLYPVGRTPDVAGYDAPFSLALHVSGPGCVGAGFEVDLALELQAADGRTLGGLAEVVSAPLAGGGQVVCDQFWCPGVAVAIASCRVLAALPPLDFSVLRLTSNWEPPKRAVFDVRDCAGEDGDDDETSYVDYGR
mmetsp:Transcript_38629/g.106396  ORF Transcript_38629/g.106396 Transcript_38629/m.106396 type:complete len:210 (-) Transcript_38629:161-790(-)